MAATICWKIPEVRNTTSKKYTHLKSEKEKHKDLLLNQDEDVGATGTQKEGEPELDAIHVMQNEVG